LTKELTMDLAYSHAWVRDPSFNITATSGNPSYNGTFSYVGTGSSHFDIVSVAFRYAPTP